MTFECDTFDDWLQEYVASWNVKGQGSDYWAKFAVQTLDYIANPAILVKN